MVGWKGRWLAVGLRFGALLVGLWIGRDVRCGLWKIVFRIQYLVTGKTETDFRDGVLGGERGTHLEAVVWG